MTMEFNQLQLQQTLYSKPEETKTASSGTDIFIEDNLHGIDCPEKIIQTQSTNNTANVLSYIEDDIVAEYIDESLHILLTEWNLEHIYNICIENNINITTLKYMTPHFMEKLFTISQMDLGSQIIFSHHLSILQSTEAPAIISDISTKPSDVSTSFEPENCKKDDYNLDVKEILQTCSQGRSILVYYKSNQNLNDGCRKIVLELIINYIIQNDIRWSVKLAANIAQKIKNFFPTEEDSYYYMKEIGKAPMGALYIKYYNTLRKLKNSGLKSIREYRKITSTSETTENILIAEDNIDEILNIIEDDNVTWAEIEQHWQSTTNYRVSNIMNEDSTTSIFLKWKQYKKNLGYKLIDIDYKTMFPNSESLLRKYPTVSANLINIIREKVKDPDCVELLREFGKLDHVTENAECCLIMYLLHGILVPTSKETITENNRKRIVKYSIKDSQKSFLLIGATPTATEENLKKTLESKQSIQPFIIITGSVLNPKDILVYFDGIKYKLNSFIQAVDICFKIFMVFNLRYPTQSILVWNFLQKYMYNITTKFDKNHPAINMLLSKLNK